MFVGIMCVLVFISKNASLFEILQSGFFRSVEIKEGTGIYFYGGLLSISGGAMLGYAFYCRYDSKIMLLVPAILVMVTFWPLGGRVRSITPIFIALLVIWYSRKDLRFRFKYIFYGSVILISILGIFFLGLLYRGGSLELLIDNLSVSNEIFGYLKLAFWEEFGQLHSIAGSLKMHPGVLMGRTFVVMFWPFNKILNIGGRSTGIYIVENLIGFDEKRWGIHASLIGDSYVNFGVFGLVIVLVIFGMFQSYYYNKLRKGNMNVAIYSIWAIYSVRIFFESIEKYPELLVVLTSSLVIYYWSKKGILGKLHIV
jgi:oligosaccharide repeat unit polymerase